MDKNNLIKTVKELKETSQKRNFKQTVDLIVSLKNIDLKKTPIDFFTDIHNSRGKKMSICCLVGAEMKEEAKNCDEAIMLDDFKKYQEDKKLLKRLADKHDFFIAQANLMAQVATTFGRALGSKGKMPNPKAGCVVPPKTPLKPLYEKLQKTLRIRTKGGEFIQAAAGSDDMPDEQIADNIYSIYMSLVRHLPAEENNINNIKLKLTMSKPVKVDGNGNIMKEAAEEKKAKK
jgi:large subunit ribosomal protein L1